MAFSVLRSQGLQRATPRCLILVLNSFYLYDVSCMCYRQNGQESSCVTNLVRSAIRVKDFGSKSEHS